MLIDPHGWSLIALHADIPDEARRWRNDKEVWQWCRQNTLLSEADHTFWLERLRVDKTIKMFGVVHRHDNTPMGVCGLTSIDRVNQSAEFSLYIATEYQGRGFGKVALRILLHHAFMDQNLNRVWGETYDGNPAIKMFEKLGMKHEGTLRQSYYRDGRFIDSHIYAILRGDYVQRNAPAPGGQLPVDGNRDSDNGAVVPGSQGRSLGWPAPPVRSSWNGTAFQDGPFPR